MASITKQYAVIEARWTERPSERLVISYSDEEFLWDLIAGPNILAYGFPSFRDAEAHIDANLMAAAPRTRNPRISILSRGRNLEIGFCLTQTWRILHEFSQAALAVTVLAFYSKNAISTAIRSLVGSMC